MTDLSAYTAQRVLLGLLGNNIQKSLSPAMHQEEARYHGLHLLYQLMDLEQMLPAQANLSNLLDTAQAMGFAGVNVTFPYKQAVLPLLDAMSDDAAAIGAVNTVVFQAGKKIGYNTDCSGYSTALSLAMNGRALGRVVLIGAGGAGSAVAHGLMRLGADHLTVVDTDAEKTKALASNIAQHYGVTKVASASDAQAAVAQADGIVNATPLGMAGIGGEPVPAVWVQASHWVSDVVYSPIETAFLKQAADKGCLTVDGGGMNIYQGVTAFELFTGITPDAQRMGRYFKQLLAHRGM